MTNLVYLAVAVRMQWKSQPTPKIQGSRDFQVPTPCLCELFNFLDYTDDIPVRSAINQLGGGALVNALCSSESSFTQNMRFFNEATTCSWNCRPPEQSEN